MDGLEGVAVVVAKAEAKAKIKDAGRLTEATLLSKYPHLIEGSLRWNHLHNKQEGTITCIEEGCGVERDVFSSDLFQIVRCEEHTKLARKARMKAKKADAKAARAAQAQLVAIVTQG